MNDCVPLDSYSAEDPVTHSLNTSFFKLWGNKLAWTNRDMLQQITTAA